MAELTDAKSADATVGSCGCSAGQATTELDPAALTQ